MIHRCTGCARRVWPWQRQYWFASNGTVEWWHAMCVEGDIEYDA